ncbi:MAG TPA: 4Fe-4S dicluster domain-containing protein [Thermoguttaceae bacterium]
MTHVICEPCYECKTTDCVDYCPVVGGCFHEGDKMLYINPAKCIDCEACVAACPVNAIFLDENVPEKWQSYIELNAQMAPKLPPITEMNPKK